MIKAIMETSPDINLNISADEIVQVCVDTSSVVMGDQYRVKRICTERDNDSKAVMDAHLEERASHYILHYSFLTLLEEEEAEVLENISLNPIQEHICRNSILRAV